MAVACATELSLNALMFFLIAALDSSIAFFSFAFASATLPDAVTSPYNPPAAAPAAIPNGPAIIPIAIPVEAPVIAPDAA